MSPSSDPSRQKEKELHAATRPFEEVSLLRSWWHIGSTFACMIVAVFLAGALPWWPLRLACSILSGLILVRAFIVLHDSLHQAIARGSRVARILINFYGLLVLTPPRGWRHSHNYHHAHVGKALPITPPGSPLVTSNIGAYSLMSTEAWSRAGGLERLAYRLSRHPLLMMSAYVTVFFYSLCVAPLMREPRKNWDGAVSIVLHISLVAFVWWMWGFQTVALTVLLPASIAAAAGAYLFFVQHNYPGMKIFPVGEWSHYRGAVESSSYLQCGPLMRWFTGNIGYHHVHHLNALIPFYRLPEAMAAIPELQHPAVTSFRPRDVWACLRLNLWDAERQQLVSYREANLAAGAVH